VEPSAFGVKPKSFNKRLQLYESEVDEELVR